MRYDILVAAWFFFQHMLLSFSYQIEDSTWEVIHYGNTYFTSLEQSKDGVLWDLETYIRPNSAKSIISKTKKLIIKF